MRTRTLLTLATLLLLGLLARATTSPGAPHWRTQLPPPPVLDPTRTVVIDGPLLGRSVLSVTAPMLTLVDLDATKPVDLVIDSPGGDVEVGYQLVSVLEAVRARGTTLRCFVPRIAASMAFQLLLHCDERYALNTALLLWHGARVYPGDSPITQETAVTLSAELEKVNVEILTDLVAHLGPYLSDEQILLHFLLETLHRGSDLEALAPGFLTAHPYIPGLLEVLGSPTVPRTGRSTRQLTPRSGSIWYIQPGTLRRETLPAPTTPSRRK